MSNVRTLELVQWHHIFASCFLCFGALLFDYARILYRRSKMPPGPLPLPVIGNVLQLPKEKPRYRFEEWSKKYDNPVITVWIGRNPIVVLNDAWTASDLMDKRANNYSSRPVFQVPGRLMGGTEWDLPLIPYNDRWRRHRKLMVCNSLTALIVCTWLSAHKPFEITETSNPMNRQFYSVNSCNNRTIS